MDVVIQKREEVDHMTTHQALALGDYKHAKYHPFTDVDREIEKIFEGEFAVTSTEDYEQLDPRVLESYSLVISYTEFAKEPLPSAQTAALLSYVANGGGLLAIHNGISLQRSQELGTMLGAKFTGHPPFTALPIKTSGHKHPITEGVDDFVMDEEPYRFDMYPHYQTTILAEYEHDGQLWPAAWTHEYGLGRVVYLMPGHQLASFSVKPFRELIRRGGLWAAQLL